MGGKQPAKKPTKLWGGRPGKTLAPLEEKLNKVKWGEYNVFKLFGKSTRGKRLKGDDRIPGALPFVTAGEADTGISAFIGNDVEVFKRNTTTIDMFGSAKYRNYDYGADDHVAVVHTENIPMHAAMFITAACHCAAHTGEFNYGHNFYAKDADELTIMLPQTSSGEIDFAFMESFVRELEESRLRELEAYLLATGLNDYQLTTEDKDLLDKLSTLHWEEFNVIKVFDVKNTHNILSCEIKPGSGIVPYLCASSENNGVSSYINYDDDLKENGNCIFIGGKTFVVSYQSSDFFSNDSHNLALYFKAASPNRLQHLFLATCINKGLGHKYTWGDSISKAKIQNDSLMLPINSDGYPALDIMERMIAVVQKLVIADVAKYTSRRLDVARSVVKQTNETNVKELHPSVGYPKPEFEPLMAAEPFECYKWNRFDQIIVDFFDGDKTILVGCSKNKKHLEWIVSHNLYNVRLGDTKGSMEKYRDMFGQTSLLLLYDFKKPDKLSAYSITGNKEMTKQELLQMGYPNPQRMRYMTFQITPIEKDLTLIANQHLIEKLIEMNPSKEKGTPVFIEP